MVHQRSELRGTALSRKCVFPGTPSWADGRAKAETVGAQLGPFVAPVGRAASEGIHVPGSTAQGPPWLTLPTRGPRPGICGGIDVVRVPHVFTPFPDVARHVVQPPVVRLLEAHRVSAVFAVRRVPGELSDPCCIVTEEVLRVRTSSTGVLPFSLTREPQPRASDVAGPGQDVNYWSWLALVLSTLGKALNRFLILDL